MNPYLSNETSVLILFSTLTLPHFLVELKKKKFPPKRVSILGIDESSAVFAAGVENWDSVQNCN